MTDVNTVSLTGNIVKDPELKEFASGGVINFTIACNESRKVEDKWEDYANFIDVSYFSKGARNFAQYLGKGTSVAVSGRIHQDRWEGQDGKKNSRIKINAETVRAFSRGSKQDSSDGMPDDKFPF